MRDLGEYHVQINAVFSRSIGDKSRAKELCLKNLKLRLAENLINKHTESQEDEGGNFGISKVSISGYFFNETEMGEFINSMTNDIGWENRGSNQL